MATSIMDGDIVLDDKGSARLAGSRIRVIDLVESRMANGWTPEEIFEQFPHLTLAKIYAAFSYYYKHQQELDAEIERRFQAAEAYRIAAGESPVAKRLRQEGKIR